MMPDVKTIIEILNGIRPELDFTASDDYFEAGMLDSFDMVLLVEELDKNFGISIDGTDILPENFRSLAAIEALVRMALDQ
jgi:methoxymalonate biosynthesis acyl carrier protein